MKAGVMAWILVLCLLLTGCMPMGNEPYIFVQKHEVQSASPDNQTMYARNYRQLYETLAAMIEKGVESGVILVPKYNNETVIADANRVLSSLKINNPIVAYALDAASFDLGSSGGEAALAVQLTYVHDKAQIRQIKHITGMAEAEKQIQSALNNFDVTLVLHIDNYVSTDFVQVVENYAAAFPEYVMEQPQVTANLYPESGRSRVVELKFSYQTSRETLKEMQQRVRSMFSAATVYVAGNAQPAEKYAQLYAFLMERYDYTLQASITPAYSLLLNGVGDARAFAVVYAAMCTRAGLDCHVVSGTRAGEPYHWNMVQGESEHFHLDLLRCSTEGSYRVYQGQDMIADGYVWNLLEYPVTATEEK